MKKINLKKVIKFCVVILLSLIFIKSIKVNIDVIKANTKLEQIWAIGLYEGDDITKLQPKDDIVNPILSAKDVTDVNATFVADPFLVQGKDKNYMFFEVLNKDKNKGVIGVASGDDMKNWKYEKVVLEEEFHLSYPQIFEYNNEYYMLPEGGKSGYLNLYKAKDFPFQWEKVSSLLRGNYADSTIFQYRDKWWLLNTQKDDAGKLDNNLHLYYSNNPIGGWQEHPKSPIRTNDNTYSRNAGKILVEKNRIVRFTQNCSSSYGENVSAFQITKLTTEDYEEKIIGQVLDASGDNNSWNEKGMHQCDVTEGKNRRYIAVVDGNYVKKSNVIIDNYKKKLNKILGIK